LVDAGVAPEVAAEIASALDAHWQLIQVLGPNLSRRTRLASDVLFAVLPDLPHLVLTRKVEVDAARIPSARSTSTIVYDISANGDRVTVQIQGRLWDVEIGLRRDEGDGSPAWEALKSDVQRSKAAMLGRQQK
jgi:hypothetical protein